MLEETSRKCGTGMGERAVGSVWSGGGGHQLSQQHPALSSGGASQVAAVRVPEYRGLQALPPNEDTERR
jgi:hypothetical protein